MKYFLYPDNASGFEIMFLRTKIANSAEESYGGWWLAAFYERQLPFDFPLIQLPLDFIAGIGTHVGYYPYRYFKIVEGNAEYYPDHTISMGIDLLIALEYVVPLESLPFAIGIEAQPFVEFLHRGPENLDFAVTLKYVFHTD